MGKYIKYERITDVYDTVSIQKLFDTLIKDGKEILYYSERTEMINTQILIHAIIVTGKLNNGNENVL